MGISHLRMVHLYGQMKREDSELPCRKRGIAAEQHHIMHQIIGDNSYT